MNYEVFFNSTFLCHVRSRNHRGRDGTGKERKGQVTRKRGVALMFLPIVESAQLHAAVLRIPAHT